jgi:hypothetical protein
MLIQLLIILSVFNVAGFTVIPFLCSKDHPLSWGLPAPAIHKLIGLLNISIIASLIGIHSIFIAAIWANLVFDFRYIFNKAINGELPKIVFGNLIRDIDSLFTYEFKSGKADFDIFYSTDNRIMVDVAMFVCNLICIYSLI